ncbi:MAG: hypothetical protein ABI575_08485 [Oxalobacteraceae bacterium]
MGASSKLAEQWNAKAAVGPQTGMIAAISDAEVIQHIGQSRYVVWSTNVLSGAPLVVGKNVEIDKDGKVQEPKGHDKDVKR